MLTVVTLLISAECPASSSRDFNENMLWIIPVTVIVVLLILGAIILAIVLLTVCITVSGLINYMYVTYKITQYGSAVYRGICILKFCMSSM